MLASSISSPVPFVAQPGVRAELRQNAGEARSTLRWAS